MEWKVSKESEVKNEMIVNKAEKDNNKTEMDIMK
jgi:hypothetical protein